jgi:hypothetical protein
MTKPKTLATLTSDANRSAGRQTITTTLRNLASLEATLRSEARTAYEVGLTDKSERILRQAADLSEARDLIETHALPQD